MPADLMLSGDRPEMTNEILLANLAIKIREKEATIRGLEIMIEEKKTTEVMKLEMEKMKAEQLIKQYRGDVLAIKNKRTKKKS